MHKGWKMVLFYVFCSPVWAESYSEVLIEAQKNAIESHQLEVMQNYQEAAKERQSMQVSQDQKTQSGLVPKETSRSWENKVNPWTSKPNPWANVPLNPVIGNQAVNPPQGNTELNRTVPDGSLPMPPANAGQAAFGETTTVPGTSSSPGNIYLPGGGATPPSNNNRNIYQ